jgi:hypothetical protein
MAPITIAAIQVAEEDDAVPELQDTRLWVDTHMQSL